MSTPNWTGTMLAIVQLFNTLATRKWKEHEETAPSYSIMEKGLLNLNVVEESWRWPQPWRATTLTTQDSIDKIIGQDMETCWG